MSFSTVAEDTLSMLSTTLVGLETIQKLTNVGGDKAAEALTAIAAIVDALKEGFEQRTTPDLVLAQLKTHEDALAAGDAAAQQAIHDKAKGAP